MNTIEAGILIAVILTPATVFAIQHFFRKEKVALAQSARDGSSGPKEVVGKAQAPAMILKISVLSSGSVLLDGNPITLADLKQLLQSTKGKDAVVWYYRESPDTEPSPQAKDKINLILKSHLSISFSSRPDFSDYIDSKGVSHPKMPVEWDRQTCGVRMPDIAVVPNIEEIFMDARRRAANTPRALTVIRPDRTLAISRGPDHPPRTAVASMKHFISPAVKRNIAVIAYTGFGEETFASTSVADANKAIPFLGILLGLAHIGHSVWIFEGHSSAIAAGCRGAVFNILRTLICWSSMVLYCLSLKRGGTTRPPKLCAMPT